MPRTKADETKTSAKAKAAKKVADTKEVGQAVAAEVDDAKTAVKIETKKTTRAAGRKVKGAIAEAVDKVETKIDNKKLVNEMAAGRVKAKRERKATEKQTAKEEKTYNIIFPRISPEIAFLFFFFKSRFFVFKLCHFFIKRLYF